MLSIKNCIESSFSYHYNKRVIHRLVFVRHGETRCNVNLMNNGGGKYDLNSNLTIKGHIQSNEVSTFFEEQNYNPDFVFCSPLNRAIDTANKFKSTDDLIIDMRLVEINKKETKQIKNYNDEDIWIYQKESESEFRSRINSFMKDMKLIGTVDNPVDTLIYTHSQVIDRLLGKEHKFHVSNCSFTVVDIFENGESHILAVNYTKHLNCPSEYYITLV